MTLNAKIGVLWIFWRFRAATHILRANCAKITTDGPVQPAYEVFDIKHRFFKVACAKVYQRWVPLKGHYFTAVGCMRRVTPSGGCKRNAIDTSLHNNFVECQLLGSVSLDFVCSGPSNIHHCCTFPFALARLSCCTMS